jgi:hypothetical protein
MSRFICLTKPHNCHRSRAARKMKQRMLKIWPTRSGNLLPYSTIGKTAQKQSLKLDPALPHCLLQPATPARVAPDRPGEERERTRRECSGEKEKGGERVLDLFIYKIPFHRKWVRLKFVLNLLLDALFCFNSYFLRVHH